ncbi:MAG: hypothetical protein J6Y02_02530 [Pseudobutyrivibrio sp.]|nr:hypothetical protein [Pseudobutyrivibrio sp.]
MMPIWLTILLIIIAIVVTAIVMIVLFAIRYPNAGTVVIDIRRTATDSIYIESPKNITKWQNYKMLRFNVEIKQFENPREF